MYAAVHRWKGAVRRHRPRRDPFNSAFTTGATPPATVIRARLRKASSILSHSPRFPTKLSAHSSRYPPTPPTASLTPLLTELSFLSTYSSVQLSLHRRAPHHAYRVLVGILYKGDAIPFWSDITGQREAQVGRRHAIRKRGL